LNVPEADALEPEQAPEPETPPPIPTSEEDDGPYLIPENEPPAPIKPRPEPPPPDGPATVAEALPERVRSGGDRKVLSRVIDMAVGFILLGLGVFLGELLAGKPTRQVWNDAGSAVSFPPVELILWLGPPAVFMLVHGLLVSKEWSVGGWLKRRG
jgi:hypothetical protein